MMMQQAAKLRSRKRAEIDHGVAMAQLPEDQRDQARAEQNGQRLHAPEGIAQPVPFLSLAEHHLPADHDDHQQRQADRVEAERLLAQLRALRDEIVRIAKQDVAGSKGQEADRDVDQEDPAPGILVGDPAAEGRADDRRHQGRQAEQRHRHALLFARKGVEQHALAGGLKTAAGQALDHAEQDQLIEAGGHPAQPRGEGEDGDRQQEVVAATEMGRQPAGDRQDDGVGGEVAGDNPFAVVDRRRQAAGDVAQRDDRDGGVEHLHEGGHHDDRGDEPGVRGALGSRRPKAPRVISWRRARLRSNRRPAIVAYGPGETSRHRVRSAAR